MPVEQDVKAYSLIKAGDLLKPKEPSRYRELPEGIIQIGGHYHAGREEFAAEAVRRQSDKTNPALSSFMGEEGLSLEDNESIVLPEQVQDGTKALERAPGNIGKFDKELARVEDTHASPSIKANALSQELEKIESQLKEDLAAQNALIEEHKREIVELREAADKSSGWLTSVVNAGYSAFHHFSKWAHLGICKEPLTSAEEQNKQIVSLKEQEIEFRKVQIAELEERIGEIGRQKSSLNALGSTADEGQKNAVVERVLEETRQIIIDSKDKSQEVRSLESRLKLQLEAVKKGSETLDAQREFNAGVCQGIEKGIVVGLAIGGGALVTFMTGGAALPWYTSMIYGLGMAMAASAAQAGSHMLSGSDVETEIKDIKADFKDAVLYSASGVLNRLWIATRTLATAKTLGFAAEVGSKQVATSLLGSLASRASGFISGLGSGLRNEIIPAAYDSFYGDKIDVLDPTGEFRKAVGKNNVSTGLFSETDMLKLTGIDNFRIRMKNFTERIGSAGVSGATAHSLSGLRGRWGFDQCFKPSGANALMRLGQGLRGLGVEATTDAVELGVDVINGCLIQATWVPFLYGLEQKPKDQREVMQMVASGIGGAISGRLNNTLRNQAEKHGERLLTNAQDRFRATGKNMGDAQGVVGPDVALSASSLPLMLEGNKRTTVAANLGAQHSQLERSSIMQEHRLTGKQAANIDARKGGVSADIAKNAGQVILTSKRSVDHVFQENVVGKRRGLAVDATAKALERSVQSLANASDIDGDYVDKLINARKIQSADQPKGILQKVLGFIDQAAHPYGKILNVDSVVEADSSARKLSHEQRLEDRKKWLETDVLSIAKWVNIKWGGIKIGKANLLFYDGQSIRHGLEYLGVRPISLSFNDYKSHPFWKTSVGQVIAKPSSFLADVTFSLGRAVIKSDTFQFAKHFAVDGVVKPVSGILFGTLLLPTTTIWMGPGVLPVLEGDVTRKTVYGSTPRNILGAFNQRVIRKLRLMGMGDAVAAGEMLNRKVELEVVRDEIQRVSGPNPNAAQKKQLQALDAEMQRTEIHYNRANKVGFLSIPIAWLGARGDNRKLFTESSRHALEAKIRETYESALGRRGVVADSVDAAHRNVKSDITDRYFLTSKDPLKNRNAFMAKVDFLLGNESILTDAKKTSIRGDIIAALSAVRTTSAAEDRIINDLKAEINARNTDHYKQYRSKESPLTLKSLQDAQNSLDRTKNVRSIVSDLEDSTIAPHEALRQLEDLFNHATLGKTSMVTKDGAYKKFKELIGKEVRQLSRRASLFSGTEILLSKEYDALLKGIAAGNPKQESDFKEIFDGKIHANFIKDVLIDPATKSVGTPMETILRNWSTLSHSQKLKAIIDSENALISYRATAGPVSPTYNALCDQVINDIKVYRQFSMDLIARGLQPKRLNELVASSDVYKTEPVLAQYQSILNFAQHYSDPSAFIEAKATRYEQLMALESPTPAEIAEWAAIRAEVQDLKLHVGTDIFRSTLDGFKHVNDRNKRLQGVVNLHDATLSPILELDKLMSAISKAGNDKNSQQAEKRKVIEDFVRDLGGDVSKKNIDAIINSEGAEFNDFYRVIGELRSGVNRVRAEAALTAALAHVGIKDAKARKFINMVSRPVDHTTIAAAAGNLGLSVSEYIDLIDRAYGDRADLAGTFGRNKYSKAVRVKAQEQLEAMLKTKTEQNNQYTENILGAVSSFFVL